MSTFDGQTIEASGVTKLEATRRGTITQQLDLWSSRCVLRPLLAENFDFDLARLRELFSPSLSKRLRSHPEVFS
jgi:hypothetical protein